MVLVCIENCVGITFEIHYSLWQESWKQPVFVLNNFSDSICWACRERTGLN